MTDDAYGATIAKRRLSRRLTELRVATGYTANHVCDILNWGRGKVGRFEANQWKRPEMSDIRDLFRVYDVPAGTQEELEDLAIRARGRPWWRDYPEIFDNEFPGFENDATRIRVFMPLILPGLLQTPAYVEALMRAGSRPPAWREKVLATRLRRQEILQRSEGTAPALNAVITEASLMYRWGTRADRYEQVVHLTEIGRRHNVELRIQRFIDGPYPGMHSMINIFGYPDAEPSLVYMETDYAIEEVSNAESVNAYVQAFGRASEGALEPADTAVFLRQLAEQLE
jgi:transcriptional regulator with XRE-family HTH domain